MPRATNSIISRILIFYLGALLIIMILVPWNQLSPTISPFVLVFTLIGVPGAAHVINVVVITAAVSSCNSGLYSTGRMLYTLALRGYAPHIFSRLSRSHVPAAGVHASAAAMLVGIALNYVVPEEAFTWVTSIALIGTLWTWIIILVSHRNYRRRAQQGLARSVSFRMPGAPLANWFAIVFLVIVAGMLWLTPDTRVALYVAPVWFALLATSYAGLKARSARAARGSEPSTEVIG